MTQQFHPTGRCCRPALAALIGNLLLAGLASAGVVIDLAVDHGPATHRASGFLWGISATKPADEWLVPIKPQLYRSRLTPWMQDTGLKGMARMAALGSRLQVVISDEYALQFPKIERTKKMTNADFGYPNITKWPGDGGDWQLWDQVVRESFERVREAGLEVEWDIWEEPNFIGWWGAGRGQFFETWTRTVRLLRELDSDAIIVGPSINRYQPDYLYEFLLYAKAQNVLPDRLAWHELIEQHNPTHIEKHVEQIRAFKRENGIADIPIQINEFVSPERMNNPGMHVWYLSYLDRAGVDGAVKATWLEPSGIYNAWWPTIGGLLTHPDHRPRSTWWVYKHYADITGHLVGLEGDGEVFGIAGVDPKDKALRILLGRNESKSDDHIIEIRNLDRVRWLLGTGYLKVRAQHIPASGWNALEAPAAAEVKMRHFNPTLKLKFPILQANEALFIEIVPL